jgi:hypothetical protein
MSKNSLPLLRAGKPSGPRISGKNCTEGEAERLTDLNKNIRKIVLGCLQNLNLLVMIV